jgi:ADP-ribose pyrophosphatase
MEKNKSAFKFKGKLLSLATRKIRLPNGYVADFEIIEHPGAVLIIPFLTKDKILLLRQFRAVLDMYMYELPAGTLKKNESHSRCARREIVEETGYSAKRLERLGVIYPVPGYSTEKIVIYKAEGLRAQICQPEKDEILQSFTVTRPQVRELFEKGKIVDAKTISAFALCGWL